MYFTTLLLQNPRHLPKENEISLRFDKSEIKNFIVYTCYMAIVLLHFTQLAATSVIQNKSFSNSKLLNSFYS